MDLGFETIGNATLIAHDRGPVLVTDPWITPSAYFGSWTLNHEIPEEQLAAIKTAPYVWFSHGHPDHLNGESAPHFKGKTILLPDHHGGRIKADLEREGHTVRVLEDRKWTTLSERVRVLCIPDYNQDAILLVDVGGRLVVDLNDANDRGWATFVRREVQKFERSFLLALTNYGDADMMNVFDDQGEFLLPQAAMKWPLSNVIVEKMRTYGTKTFIPFSSLHRYQRDDSVWANEYAAGLSDYPSELPDPGQEILPAYIRYDCRDDSWSEIRPRESSAVVRPSKEFGDDWSERLEKSEATRVSRYFRSIAHLSTFLDYVTVRVGGHEHVVELRPQGFSRGITFEVPRASLMTAVQYEVFDDLLIGNFMRAILHGKWPASRLYPDFTPYVAKYADNGRAKSKEELEEYFRVYRRRAPLDFLRHRVEERSKKAFRTHLSDSSPVYKIAKKIYWTVKQAG